MDTFGDTTDHYNMSRPPAPHSDLFEPNSDTSWIVTCSFAHENTSSTAADDELTYIMQPAAQETSSEMPGKMAFNHHQTRVVHHHQVLHQDQAKLDKKRERNRIAASKCRQRKLEKIQTLEEQVFRLRRENEDLRNFSERLNDNLEKIKTQLDFHLSQGCNLDSPKLPEPLPSFGSTSKVSSNLLPPDSTCLS